MREKVGRARFIQRDLSYQPFPLQVQRDHNEQGTEEQLRQVCRDCDRKKNYEKLKKSKDTAGSLGPYSSSETEYCLAEDIAACVSSAQAA